MASSPCSAKVRDGITKVRRICNQGYSPSSGSACLPCESDKYVNTTAATACLDCKPGYFSPPGAVGCSPCDAGTFSNRNTTGCEACAQGSSSTDGSSECVKCPPGYIDDGTSLECVKCDEGFGTNGYGTAECESCSALEEKLVGTDTPTGCKHW